MSVTITPENYTAPSGYLPRVAWRVTVGNFDSGLSEWGPVTCPAGSTIITVYSTGDVMFENNSWITVDGHNYIYNENAGSSNNPTLTDMGSAVIWPWIIGGVIAAGCIVLLWKRKR